MPQTTIARGNELYDWIVAPTTLTWSGAVGATSAAELTTTVSGLLVGDWVSVSYNPPAGTAILTAMPYGFDYTNVRVTAANTLGVTFNNTTAGGLTPPSTFWILNIVRPEAPNNLPNTAA